MVISSHALPVSFAAALTAHTGILVCVGWFGLRVNSVDTLPDFSYQSGESATVLMIVPTRASRAQQTAPPPVTQRRLTSHLKLKPTPEKLTRENLTPCDTADTTSPIITFIADSSYSLPAQPRKKPQRISPAPAQNSFAPRLLAPAPPAAAHASCNSREQRGDMQPKGVRATLRPRSPIRLVYPAAAKRRGQEGTVRLRIVLLPSGTAGSVTVTVSSGYPLLDQAAVRAYQSARYHAIIKNGIPVKRTFSVPVKWETPIQYRARR